MKKLTLLAAFLAATGAWADSAEWTVNGQRWSSGLQTINAPSGTTALKLSCGSYLNFCETDASAYLFRAGANHLRAQGEFSVISDLTVYGQANLQGGVLNSGATYGGEIGLIDNLRFISTTAGGVITSALTPTGGLDDAHILDTANALAQGDHVLTIRNAGVDQLWFNGNGDIQTPSGGNVFTNMVYSQGATSIYVVGQEADSATASGARIGNYNPFVANGSQIVRFTNSGTEKAHVAWDGAIGLGAVATTSLRNPCVNGELLWDSTATDLKVCESNAWTVVPSGSGFAIDKVEARTARMIDLLGADGDDAAGRGVRIGNSTELTTDGSLIAEFFDDNMTDNKLGVHHDGVLIWETGDSTGAPGNATINAPTGKSAIAIDAATVTITNSTVGATSLVFVTPITQHATCTNLAVSVPAAGSFVVTCAAASAVAATSFQWMVVNQ